ncbi:hypothetical protein KSP40_PGU013167 [Platanthera guangdongensis]|uniref:Uncharacterized protein n=1 Tax=Platanthera guangdongensis TaxID=2320717 RepID=A0ABR2LWY8_9ASPA
MAPGTLDNCPLPILGVLADPVLRRPSSLPLPTSPNIQGIPLSPTKLGNHCNVDCLPSNSSNVIQGEVVRVEGDEFWHMTKVLRLGLSDRFLTSSPLLPIASEFLHYMVPGFSVAGSHPVERCSSRFPISLPAASSAAANDPGFHHRFQPHPSCSDPVAGYSVAGSHPRVAPAVPELAYSCVFRRCYRSRLSSHLLIPASADPEFSAADLQALSRPSSHQTHQRFNSI